MLSSNGGRHYCTSSEDGATIDVKLGIADEKKIRLSVDVRYLLSDKMLLTLPNGKRFLLEDTSEGPATRDPMMGMMFAALKQQYPSED